MVFWELEGGETETRGPGDIGAKNFTEEEGGDDAGEDGVGEVEVVKEVVEAVCGVDGRWFREELRQARGGGGFGGDRGPVCARYVQEHSSLADVQAGPASFLGLALGRHDLYEFGEL